MVTTSLPPVIETTDLPGDISTTGVLLPDQALEGTLDATSGDTADYIRIDLVAGVEYRFDLDTDPNRYFDTFLYLYDSTGVLIRSNDDGGDGRNSRIVFTAPQTDSYFLQAAGFYGNPVGAYTLSVAEYVPVSFLGTVADETVTGSSAGDRIETLGGNDVLNGLDGVDYLDGGTGDDTISSLGYGTIIGGEGDDVIDPGRGGSVYAGPGADDIMASNHSGFIFGGDGDDTIRSEATDLYTYQDVWGGTGRDFIDFRNVNGNADIWGGAHDDVIITSDGTSYGGDGNDRLHVTGGPSTYAVADGDAGNDTLSVELTGTGDTYGSQVTLRGGEGNDFFRNFSEEANGRVTGYGEEGDDTMIGGTMRDQFYGGDGDDSIETGGWADFAAGGEGSDTVRGGAGDDEVNGGEGNDTVTGEQGDDEVGGGAGDDLVRGNTGNDQVWGGAGADRVEGGTGDDLMGGGADNDTLYGEAGNDTIWGGTGDDILWGGGWADTLFGGSGDDTLYGEGGDDLLRAGIGGDWMDGGAGDDTLVGEGGSDTFVFSAGADTAQEFDISTDILDLSGAAGIDSLVDLQDNHLSTVDGNAVITDDGGNTLTLLVVTEADLANATLVF